MLSKAHQPRKEEAPVVDALIIAFVVVGVCLAVRSIARSFSAGGCAGCGKGSHCAAAKADGCCSAVSLNADEVSRRVAEALHKSS